MVSAQADAERSWSLPRLTSPQAIRVVHVVPRLRGAAETQIRRLCERLLEYNANVTLVSVYPAELDPIERSRMTVPLIELPQTARGPIGRTRLLAAELRKLQPDIAHFHLDLGRFSGRMAALLAGQIPFVVFTDDGHEPTGFVRKSADKMLANWTNAFVVSTEAASKQLVNEGIPEKKISVIPSGGVESVANVQSAKKTREQLGLRDGEIAYILPAKLVAQKNQRLAMRALARIYGEEENWHLFLHGEGTDANMLLREAGRLHIAARVTFLRENTDLATVMPAMDIFLIPSNWERLPTAMGDAMLLGIPVVSAPWDGYFEFLTDGETGFVASDWSLESYGEAIQRALADPERAKRIARRARVYAAERFDMDAAARRHAELYYGLIRSKRR
jgi:glycosyltransferase involved in cell wall biosynthesis